MYMSPQAVSLVDMFFFSLGGHPITVYANYNGRFYFSKSQELMPRVEEVLYYIGQDT